MHCINSHFYIHKIYILYIICNCSSSKPLLSVQIPTAHSLEASVYISGAVSGPTFFLFLDFYFFVMDFYF